MPPVVECVCVFCGATMGSRRGLRIHVRKMHARLGDGAPSPQLCVKTVSEAVHAHSTPVIPSASVSDCARVLHAHPCATSAKVRLLGTGPQSGRVVALARPVLPVHTQKHLAAPAPHVPATLHFAHAYAAPQDLCAQAADDTADRGLAKMHVQYLLNPL